MKTVMSRIAIAGVAGMLLWGASQVAAQNNPPAQDNQRGQRPDRRGLNMDPEQMRQRMAERLRERLDIKNDDEWKAIQPLIEKVAEARREAGAGVGGMMGFGGPRRGGEGGGDPNTGRPRGMFGAEPLPEAEALQKALDGQASKEELKERLAKLREARKAKEAALEKAQDNLRKVLTVRQEAAAVLMGLLK